MILWFIYLCLLYLLGCSCTVLKVNLFYLSRKLFLTAIVPDGFLSFSLSCSRNSISWNLSNSPLQSYITQCIQPSLFHPSSLSHHVFHFVRYLAHFLIYYLLWYFIFSTTTSIAIFLEIYRVYMWSWHTTLIDFSNSHWL